MIFDLKKRLYEVNEILKFLPEECYKKRPIDLIQVIRANMDKKYNWSIEKNKKIYEQNLHRDTISILSYINIEYLLNEEQKNFMKRVHTANELKKYKEINQINKFNILFKKERDSEANTNALTIYKKNNSSLLEKIISKIWKRRDN